MPAQTITRVVPEAAAPENLVIIRGTNLAGATHVRFFAVVGGFVGTWAFDQPVLSASANVVTVRVPNTFGFAPPNATPPGHPLGTVSVRSGATGTNTLEFFYLAATWVPPKYTSPQTTTVGTGTTQSTGQGKPVVSFLLSGGPPQPGNAAFVMELENAVPNTTAALLIGFPSSLPFPMIGDGTLVVNLAAPHIVLAPVGVGAQGDASAAVPVPPGMFNITLDNQWVLLDGGLPGGLAVSNAMAYIL